MALREYDTFHEPRIREGDRRCSWEMSDGLSECGLLDYEHDATPENIAEVLTGLTKHPSERVWRLAQDLGNEFGLFDEPEPETGNFLVHMTATVTLRVEGMAEDMAKPHFDDVAREQRLSERLTEAVEGTDFWIGFDVSDLDVEATKD
jgi:hypothetical protein